MLFQFLYALRTTGDGRHGAVQLDGGGARQCVELHRGGALPECVELYGIGEPRAADTRN